MLPRSFYSQLSRVFNLGLLKTGIPHYEPVDRNLSRQNNLNEIECNEL